MHRALLLTLALGLVFVYATTSVRAGDPKTKKTKKTKKNTDVETPTFADSYVLQSYDTDSGAYTGSAGGSVTIDRVEAQGTYSLCSLSKTEIAFGGSCEVEMVGSVWRLSAKNDNTLMNSRARCTMQCMRL